MLARLRSIPGLTVSESVPLSSCTRFGIGGSAAVLADAGDEAALAAALKTLREASAPFLVIGGGSNLIASDEGYRGVVLRYVNAAIEIQQPEPGASTVRARAAAGAALQDLVDAMIDRGLAGLETLTGIPGWVGGAIYGNAGAYGHSIHERVRAVRFRDAASGASGELDNAQCEFAYRESVFKRQKNWIVLDALLELDRADAAALQKTAADIRKVRDEKYPPEMRCAGSIFKNLFFAELPQTIRAEIPPALVRDGKVPAAFFLEQAGAKGLTRGGVQVASYHANLIFNAGCGTARQLCELIAELRDRVAEKFGILLEEEVQHI